MQNCCRTSKVKRLPTARILVPLTPPAESRERTAASALFIQNKMPAAVLLPALLIRLAAERLLFPKRHRTNIARIRPSLNQRIPHRFGAVRPQREVVLDGAALIAMAFDRHLPRGMLLQERGRLLQCALLIGPQIVTVVIEEN